MQKSQSPRLACEIARELLDGLDYCVLHGWQGLPYDLPSDLDIALRQKNYRTLLSRIYSDPRLRLIQENQYESTAVSLWVLIDGGDGENDMMQIDAVFDYRSHGTVHLTIDELLANRSTHNGFNIASVEVEFEYLVTKKILKSEITKVQIGRIRELGRILGQKSEIVLDGLLGPAGSKAFLGFIYSEEVLSERIHSSWKNKLLGYKFLSNPVAPIKFYAGEIRLAFARAGYPNGICIAFMGTDGVGKSTAIRFLERTLKPYFWRTQSYHFKFNKFTGDIGKVAEPHGKSPRSLVTSVLKSFYYYVAYMLGYLCRVVRLRIRRGLILCDRYYSDLAIDPLRYRMKKCVRLVRFLNKILPQPDLLMIMGADVESILSRSRELTGVELKGMREAYVSYAAKEPRAQWLYVHEDSERTAHHIHQIILRILAARTARRIAAKYRYAHDHPANPLSTKLFCKNPSVEKRAETVGLSMIRLPLGRKVLVSESNAAARKAVIQSYAPTRLSGRVAKTALANQGVGPLFWRLGTVLGRTDHGIYFSDSVKNIISKIEERIKRRGLVWGAYVGSDGPSQKPLLIGADPSGGQPVIYAKLAWNAVTAAKIIRENEAMNDLAQLREAQFKSPKSAGLLEGGGWQALLIEPLPAPDSTPGVIEAARVFENIASLKRHQTRLADSVMWKMIKGALADFPDGGRGSMLRFIVDKAERRYGGQEYWFSVMHGDFAPWNLKVAGNQPCLYDWENYESEAAVGLDLVHYMIQDELLSRRRTALYAMMSVKSRLHAICTEAIKDRELADYLKMNSTPILVMYAAVEAAKWRSGGCDPESENRVYDLLAAAALELDR